MAPDVKQPETKLPAEKKKDEDKVSKKEKQAVSGTATRTAWGASRFIILLQEKPKQTKKPSEREKKDAPPAENAVSDRDASR